MKSSLKTLARIQKFSIDEQRKLLNEQLDVEEKIINALAALEEELVREKKFAEENPRIGDFGSYYKRYQAKREGLEDALAKVRQKIEHIRDVISDMFKEQKTYEIVDKNRAVAQQKDKEQKMQKTLDEIGTNAYIKHHKH